MYELDQKIKIVLGTLCIKTFLLSAATVVLVFYFFNHFNALVLISSITCFIVIYLFWLSFCDLLLIIYEIRIDLVPENQKNEVECEISGPLFVSITKFIFWSTVIGGIPAISFCVFNTLNALLFSILFTFPVSFIWGGSHCKFSRILLSENLNKSFLKKRVSDVSKQ